MTNGSLRRLQELSVPPSTRRGRHHHRGTVSDEGVGTVEPFVRVPELHSGTMTNGLVEAPLHPLLGPGRTYGELCARSSPTFRGVAGDGREWLRVEKGSQ